MTPILELKNVSAGYDHEVILHQVNLKIYEHDFLGIIGPNGGRKNHPAQSDTGVTEAL